MTAALRLNGAADLPGAATLLMLHNQSGPQRPPGPGDTVILTIKDGKVLFGARIEALPDGLPDGADAPTFLRALMQIGVAAQTHSAEVALVLYYLERDPEPEVQTGEPTEYGKVLAQFCRDGIGEELYVGPNLYISGMCDGFKNNGTVCSSCPPHGILRKDIPQAQVDAWLDGRTEALINLTGDDPDDDATWFARRAEVMAQFTR